MLYYLRSIVLAIFGQKREIVFTNKGARIDFRYGKSINLEKLTLDEFKLWMPWIANFNDINKILKFNESVLK